MILREFTYHNEKWTVSYEDRAGSISSNLEANEDLATTVRFRISNGNVSKIVSLTDEDYDFQNSVKKAIDLIKNMSDNDLCALIKKNYVTRMFNHDH